jgi:hypothetical protein
LCILYISCPVLSVLSWLIYIYIYKPGQDMKYRTGRKGQAEQERQDGKGRMRQEKQGRQKGQAEKDRQNRTGRTGKAE